VLIQLVIIRELKTVKQRKVRVKLDLEFRDFIWGTYRWINEPTIFLLDYFKTISTSD